MIAQKWKRNQQQQQNPTAAVAAAATASPSNMQKFNKKPDENLFHLTLHLTASSHKRWWKSVSCFIFCALYVFRCSSESMKTNSQRKFRYYLVSIYMWCSECKYDERHWSNTYLKFVKQIMYFQVDLLRYTLVNVWIDFIALLASGYTHFPIARCIKMRGVNSMVLKRVQYRVCQWTRKKLSAQQQHLSNVYISHTQNQPKPNTHQRWNALYYSVI